MSKREPKPYIAWAIEIGVGEEWERLMPLKHVFATKESAERHIHDALSERLIFRAVPVWMGLLTADASG